MISPNKAPKQTVPHPWEQPEVQTRVRFEGVNILSGIDLYTDASLPWDIVGFDPEPSPKGKRLSCRHTDVITYVSRQVGRRLNERDDRRIDE